MEGLTVSRLKEALIYNEESGEFVWNKDRPSNHFKNTVAHNVYKTNFAGKVAGHTCKGLNTNYVQIRLFNKLYLAHRLAWFYAYGNWPENGLDHLDGNGTNNALSNLRDIPKDLNGRNSQKKRNNTSGVNGVYLQKQINRWVAEGHYTENGVNKKKYLGCFKNIEDAAKARQDWQDEIGGFTDRHGNTP